MILVAKPAGQTPPKTEKLAQEVITYTVDCTGLLDKFELISSASIVEQTGMTCSNIRTRKGVHVEISIANDPLRTAAYIDFTIPIKLNTSFGNSRVAVFTLRVYK